MESKQMDFHMLLHCVSNHFTQNHLEMKYLLPSYFLLTGKHICLKKLQKNKQANIQKKIYVMLIHKTLQQCSDLVVLQLG